MSTQSSKVGSVGGNSIGCSGSGESKGKGILHGFVSFEPRQTTLNSTYKKDLLVDVKRRVGRFIYSAALPFNIVNDPYWPLEQMLASEDWVSSALSQTTQGKVVKRIVINDPNFWPYVAFCVKSIVPLYLPFHYMAEISLSVGHGIIVLCNRRERGDRSSDSCTSSYSCRLGGHYKSGISSLDCNCSRNCDFQKSPWSACSFWAFQERRSMRECEEKTESGLGEYGGVHRLGCPIVAWFLLWDMVPGQGAE
ncbi:hypothetical protein ZIOFF_045349 [Zingiber officinale]|uniref:Uncharacterized protein n=1 Tax=Zingiber officinale TaxID=94328 RepID=A0A8J5G7M3_ZINOF|nr:hypothetical protein ZIOFF_045349 [Zingiber officinale]